MFDSKEGYATYYNLDIVNTLEYNIMKIQIRYPIIPFICYYNFDIVLILGKC